MSTKAIKFLESQGMAFKAIPYEHKIKGAQFAAQALRFPLQRTIKTLVVHAGSRGYYFVLMPGSDQLDLKILAKVLGVKRAQMADSETAEKLTEYKTGGISPFGSKKKLPVIMHKELLQYDDVLINGGQRGLVLLMDPKDIRDITNAEVYDVAKKG